VLFDATHGEAVMAALTRAEKKLRSEIEDIASSVEMDIWNIEQHERGLDRVYALQEMKRKFVRAEIVTRYTLIDEFLTCIICDYYFHRPNKAISYRSLWKTTHFKIFVHFLMDEVFVLKKLAAVEAITKVPRDVSTAIKRINDVRNAFAHSFFPENRRRYMREKKIIYRGSDLFTLKGVETFQEDYEVARAFLAPRIFGRKRS
jgi:hypothetical protein